VDISFLTPLGALFGIAVLVPLAVFLGRQRRARRIRAALGLAEPSRASLALLGIALAAVPGLIALAAAQPVIERNESRPERVDAEAIVVLDISRSMLASEGPDVPTRLDRARRVAVRLRDALPEVPFGVASLTDRLLPHAFPTTDRRVFLGTVEESVDVERPPPVSVYLTLATTFQPLEDIVSGTYFSPTARRRLLIVLTDGETRPVGQGLAQAFQQPPKIQTVFVRFWNADERIYEAGIPEGGYRPIQSSGAVLNHAATLVNGRVFSEDEVSQAAAAARGIIGRGETRERKLEGERLPLMPYVTLAALFPLGFLLLKRNV
jgi:hypothetical protein